MIYYEDSEIKVRDIIDDDITYLFLCRIDRNVNKYDPQPLPHNCTELARECSEYCSRFENEIINGKEYKYFIITDKSDQPIGFVNFFDMNRLIKQGEMGVVIGDRQYWKRGVATRAVTAAENYIFKNMDFNRIYVETGEQNTPAIGLFNKLGFKKCGEFAEDDGFKFVVMDIRKEQTSMSH